MKEDILKMFDYFRVSEIAIRDSRHDREFWEAVLGGLPINVIHNENIKGFVILGKGEYPLKGEDLSLRDHLNCFDAMLELRSNSLGKLITSNKGGNMYLDYDELRTVMQ